MATKAGKKVEKKAPAVGSLPEKLASLAANGSEEASADESSESTEEASTSTQAGTSQDTEAPPQSDKSGERAAPKKPKKTNDHEYFQQLHFDELSWLKGYLSHKSTLVCEKARGFLNRPVVCYRCGHKDRLEATAVWTGDRYYKRAMFYVTTEAAGKIHPTFVSHPNDPICAVCADRFNAGVRKYVIQHLIQKYGISMEEAGERFAARKPTLVHRYTMNALDILKAMLPEAEKEIIASGMSEDGVEEYFGDRDSRQPNGQRGKNSPLGS